MLLLIVYWIFALVCCGYAVVRGRQDEQVGAALMMGASILSVIVSSAPPMRFHDVEVGIFAVDLLLLGALLALALSSDRFWPLWATGFHLVGVVTHPAIIASPEITFAPYAIVQGLWAYPTLLALALGARDFAKRRSAGPTAKRWRSSSDRLADRMPTPSPND